MIKLFPLCRHQQSIQARKQFVNINTEDFGASSGDCYCCQTLSRSQTHHKYWLVYPWAEQVWQNKRENIVDARLILCCLARQHVKTPQCRSSRPFSCRVHSLTHPGPRSSRSLWRESTHVRVIIYEQRHLVHLTTSAMLNMLTFGKLVQGQCPGAIRDRYFLYPVVDGEGPHLGCNLGGLITKKQSQVNSACLTSNAAGQ